MAPFTINGVSYDPEEEAPALRAAGLDSADSSHSNYIVVQVDGPLSLSEREQLQAAGVELHEHVGQDAYLCGYKPADLEALRSLPFTRWVNVYMPGFKVAPSLRTAAATDGPGAATASLEEVVPATRRLQEVDIVVHADVDPAEDSLRERIAAAAHVGPGELEVARRKLRATVKLSDLAAIGAIDEVNHIEPVPERQLYNNVAGPIMHAEVSLNGTDYTGAEQTLAVADTGFDKGSDSDVHPAFTGRVAKLYALGRTAPEASDDPDGHGTHVCGSAVGDGNSASMGGAIRGTAPGAQLVVQSLMASGGGLDGIPADLHELFLPPYESDGARVHTNSWGPSTPGLPYDASAQEIDDFVWNHPDIAICFAAGNNGSDAKGTGTVELASVSAQAAAKNCITVGASESSRPEINLTYAEVRPKDFPAEPIKSDQMADNPQGMAAFSSRGATQEGRVKPDIVAPGTSILSTRSRAVVTPPTLFGVSSDPEFFFDSGTSMATPLVAGCVAVLREVLTKNGTANPSAALLKALLINGATELPGQYTPPEAGPSPNGNSGWGLIDLNGSIIVPGQTPDAGFGECPALKQDEESTVTVTIPEGGKTLKVTLVWSDAPGAELQNDLDLIVRCGENEERHGNMGTSGEFDRVNNVEQVVWENVPAGSADLIVRAFRITTEPQPYAYVYRLL